MISEGNEHIFNPIEELAIPVWASTNEAIAEIETHPLAAEAKLKNPQRNAMPYTPFYAFPSSNNYVLFILKDNFLLHLFLLV